MRSISIRYKRGVRWLLGIGMAVIALASVVAIAASNPEEAEAWGFGATLECMGANGANINSYCFALQTDPSGFNTQYDLWQGGSSPIYKGRFTMAISGSTTIQQARAALNAVSGATVWYTDPNKAYWGCCSAIGTMGRQPWGGWSLFNPNYQGPMPAIGSVIHVRT